MARIVLPPADRHRPFEPARVFDDNPYSEARFKCPGLESAFIP